MHGGIYGAPAINSEEEHRNIALRGRMQRAHMQKFNYLYRDTSVWI